MSITEQLSLTRSLPCYMDLKDIKRSFFMIEMILKAVSKRSSPCSQSESAKKTIWGQEQFYMHWLYRKKMLNLTVKSIWQISKRLSHTADLKSKTRIVIGSFINNVISQENGCRGEGTKWWFGMIFRAKLRC